MRRTTEAMRRLGAPVADCPVCKGSFNTTEQPKHWVDTIGPMDEDGDAPLDCMQLCSQHCAYEFKKSEEARLVAQGKQVDSVGADGLVHRYSWGVHYHPDPPEMLKP